MTPPEAQTTRFVYKIEVAGDWRTAGVAGRYTGSVDDRRDGFIHFSTAAQVPGTYSRYFAGRTDLVLAQVDTNLLGGALRWEASRGGQLFPHLYAPLDFMAVTWTVPLAASADGVPLLPSGMV
jgi:uncharacterized protein (DUF952 family)